MQNKLTVITVGLLVNSMAISTALARPEYVPITGAAGCTTCHFDDQGKPPWKPGVLDAWNSNGLQGLVAFVKAGGAKKDTAPVLSQINNHWDLTVGETPLVIPLHVFDAENDKFALHGSASMHGYNISALYTDTASNLPTKDFKWAPTTADANKNYPISFYVLETGTNRVLKSNTVSADISVWPARKNAAQAKVKEFKLSTAHWAKGTLTLSGQVAFKPGVNSAKQKTLLGTLGLEIKSHSGLVVGSPILLKSTAKGSWTHSLSLAATKAPCSVKASYEGLIATRAVISAPAGCLK
jgi:hypothetical protein